MIENFFQGLVAWPLHHYLSFIFCKFVIDAIKYCVSGIWRYFFSAGMGKGIKYSQDQSIIMLRFEHNFRHNDVILRVTIKSKMLKFSGIMYLTLLQVHHAFLFISLPLLHYYDVKLLNFTFYGGPLNKRWRKFLSLSKLECSSQEINSRELFPFTLDIFIELK